MRKRLRWILGTLVIVCAGLVWWFWPVLVILKEKGLPTGPEMRKYEGTSLDNLKALRTALMLYHDNEDRFPDATGWVDAIKPMLKTEDLSAEDAARKLRNPTLPSPGADDYGYAINDAAGGKYKGDLKDPKTVLVYETEDRKKNAHGNPAEAKGQAIAVDGTILRLGKG